MPPFSDTQKFGLKGQVKGSVTKRYNLEGILISELEIHFDQHGFITKQTTSLKQPSLLKRIVYNDFHKPLVIYS